MDKIEFNTLCKDLLLYDDQKIKILKEYHEGLEIMTNKLVNMIWITHERNIRLSEKN